MSGAFSVSSKVGRLEEGVFNGGLLFVRGQQRGAPAVHEIFHVAVRAVDGGDNHPAQVQMVFRRRVCQAVQQRRQDGRILNDAVLAKRPLRRFKLRLDQADKPAVPA